MKFKINLENNIFKKMKIYINQQLEGKTKPQNKTQQQQQKKKKERKCQRP